MIRLSKKYYLPGCITVLSEAKDQLLLWLVSGNKEKIPVRVSRTGIKNKTDGALDKHHGKGIEEDSFQTDQPAGLYHSTHITVY